MKTPNIDYAALSEARAEYEAALGIELRVKALNDRWASHRRTAVRLYKAAGLTNRDIRSIMLLPDETGH